MSTPTRAELRRLAGLPAFVARYVSAVSVVGWSTRGRNTRAAELAGVTPRTIRRGTAAARAAALRCPPALPGRPPRTDYRRSRRGYRRRRGGRAPSDPVELAARAVATGADVRQAAALIRWILELWPPARFPHASPMEAAHALRAYLTGGGRWGPEAERWWRYEAPRLPLERAHTPWRAAAAAMHLAGWIAARRAAELRELEARAREARELAEPRYRPTEAELEAMRARLRGRGG